MKIGIRSNRRFFLRGLGGVTLGLPLLESLRPRAAHARAAVQAEPFAVFLRQPNGVAASQNTNEVGAEPERFWPSELGALTPQTVSGRALDELTDYLDRMLVVGNINQQGYDYGDGHARGALQGLTSRGPVPGTYGGDAQANGQSLDMFIAEHLNPSGSDSLYLHAGNAGGWLGGACIAWRSAGVKHAALRNPSNAFNNLFGAIDPGSGDAVVHATRRAAINDLVRDQMTALLAHPRLSGRDRGRLQDHFDAIHELDVTLSCERNAAEEAEIGGGVSTFNNPTGDDLVTTVNLHAKVAALAIACGLTRSAVIQVGGGNGGELRFINPDDGTLMENYHYLSHRRSSHDSTGAVIANSDYLHHQVDRHFARMFKGLLDNLDAFEMPDGSSLLDAGVCAWYNDNSNGPQHCTWDCPWVLAGSANGYLKQGEYIDAVDRGGAGARCGRSPAQAPTTIAQLHNTLASAVGVRKANGDEIDDFGDPALPGGQLDRLKADG